MIVVRRKVTISRLRWSECEMNEICATQSNGSGKRMRHHAQALIYRITEYINDNDDGKPQMNDFDVVEFSF